MLVASRILNKNSSFVISIVSIALIILSIYELFNPIFVIDNRRNIFRLIAGLLFFNTVHTIGSHLFPFFIVEYSNTHFKDYRKTALKFLASWLAFFLFFFWFIFLAKSELAGQLLLSLILVITLWHGFRQTEAAYRLKLNADDEPYWRYRRKLTYIYFTTASFFTVFFIFNEPSLSVKIGYFLFIAIIFFAEEFKHRKIFIREHFSFKIRTTVYFLSAISDFCKFGVHFIHGIEAMTIYLNLLKNSASENRVKKYLLICFIPYAVLMFFTAHIYISYRYLNIPYGSVLYSVFFAIGYAFIFNHYLIEMFIFAMKSKEIKENILPLLRSE